MKPEGWVDRHNPTPYEPVETLIKKMEDRGKEMGAMYLGTVHWNCGRTTEPGWCIWHTGGVFVNPFEADYFFLKDFNSETSTGRLLHTEEVLNVKYVGVMLNGQYPPENVPVNVLVRELQKAGKEMGAILVEKAHFADGTIFDWRTKICPHGDWVVWHGPVDGDGKGVFVNPFKAEYFPADQLDAEKTVGRLLRPDEPLQVKHYGG